MGRTANGVGLLSGLELFHLLLIGLLKLVGLLDKRSLFLVGKSLPLSATLSLNLLTFEAFILDALTILRKPEQPSGLWTSWLSFALFLLDSRLLRRLVGFVNLRLLGLGVLLWSHVACGVVEQ